MRDAPVFFRECLQERVNPVSHVFGPVPSRRLGRSLGVDLVSYKACSYDCVYCQLGRTTLKTVEQREYVPTDEVIAELRKAVEHGPEIDYITFSGSGEPTLHSRIGEVIRAAKALTSIPVAVLTNGSLLHDPEVRRSLREADLVIPSLDAGCQETFQTVNRPHESLALQDVAMGIRDFSVVFPGRIWVEVMLVKGMNDGDAELERLAELLRDVRAEKVQLNTVARPPAEPFASPLDPRRMKEACSFFGGRAEVICGALAAPGVTSDRASDIEREILEMLRRRPCTARDISEGLQLNPGEASKHLGEMATRGVIRASYHGGKRYYRCGSAS